MRVLLAGGAGFIGSHLADSLVARGDEVVAIDNLITGRRSNIEHLFGHVGFTFVEHDVTVALPEMGDFDAVLDLASPASPDDFLRIPLEILEVGSTGTRNLLELSVRQGARFLLASTSEVYGDPLLHPQTEDYWGNVDPIGPRSCYDEAKRFSEALTAAYERARDADVQIVRIFNTYGERMRADDGRVVTNFVVQALKGEPITLHGTGQQTRSFCHVSDQVRGQIAALEATRIGPVNIGNPIEITMRELAELVIEMAGSSSEIITVPLPPERSGDPQRRCPDITKARAELGWEPRIELREGLVGVISSIAAEIGHDTPLRGSPS